MTRLQTLSECGFKVPAQIGDSVKGDEWSWHCKLDKSDGFSDSSFPGCEFRLSDPGNAILGYAVNIKTTGKPKWNGINYQSRCRIEIVGDGEPSTFFGGTLYHVAA